MIKEYHKEKRKRERDFFIKKTKWEYTDTYRYGYKAMYDLQGFPSTTKQLNTLPEPKLKLNEKGQCPVCKIKPLSYKRDKIFFCHRCNRTYNMETKELQANWAWTADNKEIK